MGYETKLYLAEQFSDNWMPKEKFFPQSNPDLEHIPDGSLINTDFIAIAEVDLYYESRLFGFFEEGRKEQTLLKRYASVSYEGFTHPDGEHDQYNELTDQYGEPLGVHDPWELLDLLREAIQEDVEKGKQPYRRFVLAEAMIASCLEPPHPLKKLAAQAEGARTKSEDWLFQRLVVLSYGH